MKKRTDNGIGVEGATKISQMLAKNTTLTDLNLICVLKELSIIVIRGIKMEMIYREQSGR